MLCKNVDGSKKGTESSAEKSLLVCTFLYSERPMMSIEKVNEGRESYVYHYDASSFSVTIVCTDRNAVG